MTNVAPFNYAASNGPTPARYRADALADTERRAGHPHEPGIRACLHGLLLAVLAKVSPRRR